MNFFNFRVRVLIFIAIVSAVNTLLTQPKFLAEHMTSAKTQVLAAQDAVTAVSTTISSQPVAASLTVIPYLIKGAIPTFMFDIQETTTKLKDIGEVYYNFTYDSDGGRRGFEGRITNLQHQVYGHVNGLAYVRRNLTLGTCSKNECVYDKDPKNFILTIIATTLSGKKITKEIKL